MVIVSAAMTMLRHNESLPRARNLNPAYQHAEKLAVLQDFEKNWNLFFFQTNYNSHGYSRWDICTSWVRPRYEIARQVHLWTQSGGDSSSENKPEAVCKVP